MADIKAIINSPSIENLNNYPIIYTYSLEESDFDMVFTERSRTITGETYGQSEIQDAIYNNYTSASTAIEYDLSLVDGNLTENSIKTFYNITPTVGSIDIYGKITALQSGLFKVNANSNHRTRRGSCNLEIINSESTSAFSGEYVDGSLGEHIRDFGSLFLTSPTTLNRSLYSEISDFSGTYVRNSSILTGNLDLTCIPVWNSVTGNGKFTGVLISRGVLLTAEHIEDFYPSYKVGMSFRFVTNTNEVITRTVSAIHKAGNGLNDTELMAFSEDLPESISICKVLPKTASSTYAPKAFSWGFGVPCIYCRQNRQIYVGSYYSNNIQLNNNYPLWYFSPIAGDSGTGAFLVINNHLVVLWTWMTPSYGPSISMYYDDINTRINILKPGQSLTDIDLSGFSTFV